jgi:hypothetical protein
MPRRPTRLAAAVAAPALLWALAGCAGGGTGGTSSASSPPPASSTTAPSAALKSADVGRSYDFGVITAIDTVDGTDVVVLDRWTVKKLSDAKLAAHGIPIARYRAAKRPYINQNTKVTFRIPVTDSPLVVYRHCVAANEPLQAKSATLADLAHAGKNDRLVVVGLDAHGWLVSAQNLPGC